jgi:hypothetical protein
MFFVGNANKMRSHMLTFLRIGGNSVARSPGDKLKISLETCLYCCTVEENDTSFEAEHTLIRSML